MANPVDIDNAPGDVEGLEKSLAEAVATQNTADKAEEQVEELKDDANNNVVSNDPLAGTKFEGKSLEDVLDSYNNLQSAYGRMANDLGSQRKLTDRLLDLKREEDLQSNAPQPVNLTSAELLEDPTKALDRVISDREARTQQMYEDRLAQMEAQMVQDRFMQKHPDFMTVGQDPSFVEWTQSNTLRARVAQQAAGGDWDAADALLTEYKARDANVQKAPVVDDGAGVEEAKKIALESAAQGGDTNSQKVYRRADMIQLRLEKPEVWSDPAFQQEILKAYSEGRVK